MQAKRSHGALPGTGRGPFTQAHGKWQRHAPSLRREALHKRASVQVSILPQILFFFFIFLFFFLFVFPFFLPASGIAETEVPVCCKPDQNDVVWSLWDSKRRRFGFFIFIFKPIQNNIVLDLSHLSKRRRFG